MIDLPETLHSQRERGRLTAQRRRSDDDNHTLLIINEADGSWSIHGLGASGVRLTRDAMIVLAAQVLDACPVSAPHCIHLLAADSGVAEGHRYGAYIALCEALLSTWSLPAALCSDDCDREVAYCSDCLRVAAEVNAAAGLAYITPGTRLMQDSSPSQRPDPVQ